MAVTALPEMTSLARYYRFWEVPIQPYFGSNSHLKGIVLDTDGVLVTHNSDEVCRRAYDWLECVHFDYKIPYCLSTWNHHRLHVGRVAKKLPGSPSVIYNDLLTLPFHHPIYRAAYELSPSRDNIIYPSQLLIIDDYMVSLDWARRYGCTCIKVEPFETKREAKDSLILKFLRLYDDRLVLKKFPVEIQ